MSRGEKMGHPVSGAAQAQTEVAVWVADVRSLSLGTSPLLSSEERLQFDRFRHAADARRFAARRLLLTAIVAGTLGCRLEEVRLERRCPCGSSDHGRPQVACPAGTGLSVSVGASGERVLAAIADGPVGVDVEGIALPFPLHSDDRSVFADDERSDLQRRGPGRDRRAYELWVAKEAMLKALGTGLITRPCAADATQVSSESWQATDVAGTRIVHRLLDVGPGYVAALAAFRPTPVVTTIVESLDHL